MRTQGQSFLFRNVKLLAWAFYLFIPLFIVGFSALDAILGLSKALDSYPKAAAGFFLTMSSLALSWCIVLVGWRTADPSVPHRPRRTFLSLVFSCVAAFWSIPGLCLTPEKLDDARPGQMALAIFLGISIAMIGLFGGLIFGPKSLTDDRARGEQIENSKILPERWIDSLSRIIQERLFGKVSRPAARKS